MAGYQQLKGKDTNRSCISKRESHNNFGYTNKPDMSQKQVAINFNGLTTILLQLLSNISSEVLGKTLQRLLNDQYSR